LHDASFDQANVGDFREARKVGRMGVPPLRLEIITSASGVEFPDCYSLRLEVLLDQVRVPLIPPRQSQAEQGAWPPKRSSGSSGTSLNLHGRKQKMARGRIPRAARADCIFF